MEIGIQVSSLKPLLCTPQQVQDVFRKLHALGCRWVQLQWIDPIVPVKVIAEALGENQLQSVSVQDFYEVVVQNPDYYTQLNAATGGSWLCVSRIPDRCKSRSGLDVFAEELRTLQEVLRKVGQRLCFHPVGADFLAVPGMDAVKYLLERMPELQLCLDLYHLNRCCPDMPAFIRRYGTQICMVHFKDSHNGILVPAGQGDIHWTGVVKACLKAKIPYAFVEQEHWERDPFDCLREAMDWLERERQGLPG